jgi:hypothetical protein
MAKYQSTITPQPIPANPKFHNVTGQKFNRLTAIEYVGRDEQGATLWRCRCECGSITIARTSQLKNNGKKSCGCLNTEQIRLTRRTHGHRHTSVYNIWRNMIQRCKPSSADRFKYYAGRGIRVCKRWRTFENFLADMDGMPTPQHSIERINNDGDYEPSNCRWATATEQGSNKRNNILLTLKGRTQTLAAWARERHIKRLTLRKRLQLGWDVEKALTTPVRKFMRTKP